MILVSRFSKLASSSKLIQYNIYIYIYIAILAFFYKIKYIRMQKSHVRGHEFRSYGTLLE